MQPKELEGQNIGVYAIPGVSSGIGAKAKELLLQRGHEVINIDLKDGDICVNLATAEGRQKAVNELHRMCPDGLDRIICNAGVSGASRGVNGNVMFVDGGTDALLNSEKVY